MRRFLEMIEQAKRQSKIAVIVPNQVQERRIEKYPEEFHSDMFFQFVEQCQPFVFSPKNNSPEEIDGLKILELEQDENREIPKIDAPFKVWSAEIAGENYITVPRADDGMPLVSVIAFMAVEIDPGHFMYFMYVEYPRGDGSKNFEREVMLTVTLNEVANELIKRLYVEKTGIEPGRHKIKVGTGKNKRHVKINRVIHVRPKRLVSIDTKTDDGREIDWSHRWSVRGHWRSLPAGKVGKDRDGNYGVLENTWVTEHLKGPESAPLISKTRVVTEEGPK
jgi:hypothetical protein